MLFSVQHYWPLSPSGAGTFTFEIITNSSNVVLTEWPVDQSSTRTPEKQSVTHSNA